MANFRSGNFYTDNEDLKFYVDKYIDWEPLVELTEFDYKAPDGFKDLDEALDVYRSILEMVGEFTANEIAPHAKKLDEEHPHLKDGIVHFPDVTDTIFEKINDLELHGLCLPRGLGGMNCPFVLFMLLNEIMARADVSITAHNGFHGGMAMAMLLFSIMEGSTEFDLDNLEIKKTRFEDAIQEIIAGKAWGSMDITEPGAGSDMAAMSTKAVKDKDGIWRVSGQKIFITSGHAKYHFVIARTEKQEDTADAFAGLKGLSMFLVKAFEDDENGNRTHYATFDSLEDKLGHHGSATVSIGYDESPAELIGKRGEGFKYMLMLMNNARVGVGFESIGIAENALRLAKEYAAERFSMGKTIDKHEMIADYLDEMQTDIQGLRALAVKSSYHEEMTQKLNLMLMFMPPADEKERKAMEREMKQHQMTSRMLTPLLKYQGAEKAIEISRRSIQIHGGYGYSTEFGAEKLLRDAMVLPIYEGTSQIQSLMAMKDNLMGILKNPKDFVASNARALWLSRSSKSRNERRVATLRVRCGRALQFLMTRLAGKKAKELRGQPFSKWSTIFQNWNPKRDFALAMLHAERLTRMLADAAICEELLRQSEQFPERAEVLERYLERAEPRSKFLISEITKTGGRLLETLEEEEEEEATEQKAS
ncbi:MAG: acyl-CoA dehydrogenase family protein [Myxococcota bacterium]|nr:acyl-CoA dehydrogenase family protein [Myxococcota bacterium]